MKRVILIASAFLITLLITACGSSIAVPPEQQAIIDKQEVVYTQVNMWEGKNKVYGINYNKGLMIPVNSKVKILAVNAKVITFEFMDQKINYYTHKKYTKVDSIAMMKRIFGTKPVDLTKFSKLAQENIKAGTLAVGMTKEETIVSRGYPPLYTTLSLKADYWKFHHFKVFGIGKTTSVSFKDGKISKIEGGAH